MPLYIVKVGVRFPWWTKPMLGLLKVAAHFAWFVRLPINKKTCDTFARHLSNLLISRARITF